MEEGGDIMSKRSALLIAILILASLALVGCIQLDGRPASVQGSIFLEGAPWHHPVEIEVDGEFKGVFSEGTYQITGLESGYITLHAYTEISTDTSISIYEDTFAWRIRGGQNKYDIKFKDLWSEEGK